MLNVIARARPLALGGLLVVGAIGGVLSAKRPAPEPLVLEAPTPAPTATLALTPTAAPIVVFVSGAVRAPGVYTLPPGSRVVDALTAAGGPAADADWAALNQATLLSDGMQIHMPVEGVAPEPPPLGGAPAPSTAAGGEAAGATSAPLIRLNHASGAELEALPGIGPALAGRIIEYRESHGPFTSIEQLLEVKGIGDTLLNGIRDYIILE